MSQKIDLFIHTFTAALLCVIEEGNAVYISTPITNGPLVVEAVVNDPSLLRLTKEEYWIFVQREIIPINTVKARTFAKEVRSKVLGIVIDPSWFFDESLSQNEYLQLWERVIVQFTNSVWFNEGWAFSQGCVTEYCIALKNRIPTFDHTGHQLSKELAVQHISTAVSLIDSAGLNANNLKLIINNIESL